MCPIARSSASSVHRTTRTHPRRVGTQVQLRNTAGRAESLSTVAPPFRPAPPGASACRTLRLSSLNPALSALPQGLHVARLASTSTEPLARTDLPLQDLFRAQNRADDAHDKLVSELTVGARGVLVWRAWWLGGARRSSAQQGSGHRAGRGPHDSTGARTACLSARRARRSAGCG